MTGNLQVSWEYRNRDEFRAKKCAIGAATI
jgi:hypothetical protein